MRISQLAIQRIKENSKYLVILVELGGCKGFEYTFQYESNSEGYIIVANIILTNEFSYPIIADINIDYEDEIGYEDFIIQSDNLKPCGCGKSFKI